MKDPIKKVQTMTELGETGLKRSYGLIREEFLTKLKGTKATKVFQEMSDNDPVIGAILFAIEMLIRNVKWKVEPAEVEEDIAAQDVADFIYDLMGDMTQTWEDFIAEVLSMLIYGYSYHEVVYKLRDDGKIGWLKLPIRSQDSLYEWVLEDNGDILGFKQQSPIDFSVKEIPISKAIHFRTSTFKNNPEGRSVLRNAYRPWYFKKRIEEIEGIGIERDLAGLPVALVPPRLLSANATDDDKTVLAAIKTVVTNIRRDEQEGVVFPASYDENGNLTYDLKLLSTGGARQFDTNAIVQRYDKRIAMVVLADFILLGHDKVGSFALSSDKTELFATAIGALLGTITSTLNRMAVPPIIDLNGISRDLTPTITHEDVEKKDIEKYLKALSEGVLSGIIQVDEQIEESVRDLLDLPTISESETSDNIRDEDLTGDNDDESATASQRNAEANLEVSTED